MKKLLFVLILLGGLLFRITVAHAQNVNNQTYADIEKLYGQSKSERELAAERLVAQGPAVIPLLVSVVCDRTKPNFDDAWPAAAKALGQLKAEPGVPCLVQLLMYRYPAIGPVVMKSDDTLRRVSPAFAALEQMGDRAVPTIRRDLPMLHPEDALMALRVLRVINTPLSKEAAESYVAVLERQIRMTKEVIRDFD